MFVDESLYVSFSRPFILCIHFCHMFWEWDEWPSLRSSESLSIPSLCSLLTWPPFIFDLSISSLVLVFYVSSSYSFSLLIHHFHFTTYSVLTVTSSLGLILSSHHHYTSRHQFDFLHCIIIVTMFTVGILRSMAHRIYYTCCISYTRAWVVIIGYLSLVSLRFYHPSLHYIPCLKTTLRPWDQISSSMASIWTGVWDLVDI